MDSYTKTIFFFSGKAFVDSMYSKNISSKVKKIKMSLKINFSLYSSHIFFRVITVHEVIYVHEEIYYVYKSMNFTGV